MSPTSATTGGRTILNGYGSSRPAARGFSKLLLLGFAQISHVVAAPIIEHIQNAKESAPKDAEDPSLWLYLTVAAVLVLLGGTFAGLTIALMGQDGVYLQVIATSGEGTEQKYAQKVWNLLNKGKHWVLVTLLLSNVIVNESLPIVLDRSLGGGWPAVLGSTVLIVIFGEVIPQSVCVRYGLSIGAFMAPFVLGLMYVLGPIAWPTAKLLDKLLGEDHGTVYKKSGLKTLVTLHKTLGSSPMERLNQDEVTIISAVLDLKGKAVGDIMTPIEDVFTMSADTVLDEQTMNVILSAGYSRIPIYEPGDEQNYVGMLLVKILITYDPEDCKKVSEFALATLPETRPETSCLDIINFFQEGKSHMVLVSEYPGENYGAIGVVTLEDVIEELIGEEIIDESDVYIDVHKAIRRMAPAPKARVAKGHIVGTIEDTAQHGAEDPLIDLSDGTLIGRSSTNQSTNQATHFEINPKTTFLRRSSGGETGNTVLIRGNMDEMREHLKHLGPSNLASRPKTTRYNSVKIKSASSLPRSDSRTDSASYHDVVLETPVILEEPYLDDATLHGGEGEGLLRSAGIDAKDGVQAVQQGYGSFSHDRPSSSASKKMTTVDHLKDDAATENSRLSQASDGNGLLETPHSISRHDSHDSGRSTDTLGSLSSVNHGHGHRKRGAARSGSITENVIEAGGVRKVVLETNSSSGDDREEVHNASQFGSGSAMNLLPPTFDGEVSSQDDVDDRPISPKGKQVKKKRKRNQKKKNAKKGEPSSAVDAPTSSN